MSVRPSLLAALLVTYSYLPTARAEDGRVHLELGGCPTLRDEVVQARLALELPGGSIRRGPTPATRVRVDCAADTVRLTIDDPLTDKGLSRTFRFRIIEAEVRERIVAIAIAELVAASWAELEATPTPRTPRATPEPTPREVRDALAAVERRPLGLRRGHLRLTALASTQIFFGSAGVLFGGGMRIGADASRVFAWEVDALVHHAEPGTELGDVAIDTATVAGVLLAHKDWAHASLRGGLGFRIGASVLRGLVGAEASARGDRVVWGAGGPLATLRLGVRPVRGLLLELATEGGYWLFPTGGLVNGRRAVALEGPWLGLQLGIGVEL